MTSPTYRIGVDIGGTFTDLVLLDEGGGRLEVLKVPSTPADPAAAVLTGTRALLGRAGVASDRVSLFIHGTTLAVNTLLQRSGEQVGLLVTRGFRDLLELRRLRLREAQNYFVEKPEALVPRHLVREIERAGAGDRGGLPAARPGRRGGGGRRAGRGQGAGRWPSASSTATADGAMRPRRPA